MVSKPDHTDRQTDNVTDLINEWKIVGNILSHKDNKWREIITLNWFVITENPQKKLQKVGTQILIKFWEVSVTAIKRFKWYKMSWKVMKLAEYTKCK